jgi:hypothetical protein
LCPAAGAAAEKRAAFADVYGQIHNRISNFVSLPIVARQAEPPAAA